MIPIQENVGADLWALCTRWALHNEAQKDYSTGSHEIGGWGAHKKGMVKQGVRNPHTGEMTTGACASLLAGKIGEWAVSLWNPRFGEPDMRHLERGDRGRDLSIFGIDVQVKTRTHGRLDLVRMDHFHHAVRDSAPIVFCALGGFYAGNVRVLGWQEPRIERFRIEPGMNGGKWKNAVCEDDALRLMSEIEQHAWDIATERRANRKEIMW